MATFATYTELIALANEGVEDVRDTVNETTLRFWSQVALLPRPTRRWHDGATRALWPMPASLERIREIRALQSRGWSIRAIMDAHPAPEAE